MFIDCCIFFYHHLGPSKMLQECSKNLDIRQVYVYRGGQIVPSKSLFLFYRSAIKSTLMMSPLMTMDKI